MAHESCATMVADVGKNVQAVLDLPVGKQQLIIATILEAITLSKYVVGNFFGK